MDQSLGDHVRSETATRIQRGLLLCLAAVRGVHLMQGAICSITAGRAYRSPKRAGIILGVAAAESGWLLRRGLRRGALDARGVAVDAAASAAGLALLSTCLADSDRTASMNWMLPYSVGACAALAVSMPPRRGLPTAAALSATYLATVRRSVRGGGSEAAAAIANTGSYLGFYAVARLLDAFLTQNAAQLEAARAEAIEHGERLAAERERNRQHRTMHDSALQVLEAIGQDRLEPTQARSLALHAATEIRQTMRGDNPLDATAGLVWLLESLANDFAVRGLSVEVVRGAIDSEPPARATHALHNATREALTNIEKHAATSRAVVHVNVVHHQATVTIRDHGRGFDPESTTDQFGLASSVVRRIADVGGQADVWSQPHRGTRVRLSVPT